MVWNAQNSPFAGSGNFASYSGPNYGAYSGPNYGAYSGPNYGAYTGPNYGAYGGPNYGAYSAPNYAANSVPPGVAVSPPASLAMAVGTGTGAGGASGSGFVGGYGPVARFEYATSGAQGPMPWVLDFGLGDGWPSFPFELRIDPYQYVPEMQWQVGDWDPALRFWTLKFDPQLTEWLQDLNLGAPAVMAAREFAGASSQWLADGVKPGGGQSETRSAMQQEFEADVTLLTWMAPDRKDARNEITRELDELVDLMRDDRMRYLEELAVQSSHATPYFVHLMKFDPAEKPWTMELMNCASSIGNLVKMQYKSHYKRVRPSTLCPALTPPWGPARHPSFPSGHSTVAHLTALMLLSVPGIAQQFGIYDKDEKFGRQPELADFEPWNPRPPGEPNAKGKPATKAKLEPKAYGEDQRSPLLWLAWRIARGRERLGVHYKSDSAAGRRLAALVCDACLKTHPVIDVPSLLTVRRKAEAEWPVRELAKSK
jgi:membrane-associated phospholipid phosphatase